MEKYKNKYRIPSARLQNWDYGANAPYFVTICTAHREHYFGEIVETQFIASELGEIAEKYWHEIPEHFSFVELGAFVVMPNHVHGIIIINKTDDNNDAHVETPNLGVSTDTDTDTNRRTAAASKKWKPATLGVIINQYKRIVTIQSRKIHADFAWQSRFYDHIIRNDKSFQRIEEYILTNPQQWEKDKFYV